MKNLTHGLLEINLCQILIWTLKNSKVKKIKNDETSPTKIENFHLRDQKKIY